MAPEQETVHSANPAPSIISPEAAPAPGTTRSNIEPVNFKTLKRARPDTPPNPSNPNNLTDPSLTVSPLLKSPRFGGAFSPRFSPTPLTGAAALEDGRRAREEQQRLQRSGTSENPGHRVLSSLIAGDGLALSKPGDAPPATKALSEGLSTAANAISIPSPMHTDEKSEISPASVTSLASLGSTAQTATASTTAVASPLNIIPHGDTEPRDARASMNVGDHAISDDSSSNRAFTFPGNVLSQPDNQQAAQQRGGSLPMPSANQQLAPRSPSHKKHKCPYCDTEFTRHHNLKSHLLTHSQEKPYVCQTCQMRFRRLHDLKRHTKLHTGERPHVCPKCDRKFARGDALARHSKGQGGCAGRRSSMGSFGGDDDYEGSHMGEGDESTMDGIMYTDGGDHPEGDMTEEDQRRFSLPSIKASHVGAQHGVQEGYTAHIRTPSTYPPAGPRQRQSTGGLYPPAGDTGSGSSGASQGMQNSGHSGNTSGSTAQSGSGSMFSQGGMTESPKPLSPGLNPPVTGHDPTAINRQRSPSLTTQFQQHRYGRSQSDRSSPGGMSLPSPHGPGPKLPSLTGLAPPESRYTLPSQIPSQQASSNGTQGIQHGQPVHPGGAGGPVFQPPMTSGSGSSRGPHHQASGSGDSSSGLYGPDRGIWAYIQSLEEKVKQLGDRVIAMENVERSQEARINQLSEEVISLRSANSQMRSQNTPGFAPM